MLYCRSHEENNSGGFWVEEQFWDGGEGEDRSPDEAASAVQLLQGEGVAVAEVRSNKVLLSV